MTHARANVLLLLTGAIWGMGFVTQSTAMDHVGPWYFTGLRFVLAALTVLPLALREVARTPLKPTPTTLLKFALIGLMLFLGSAAQQIGIVTTSVTNAGFLTSLYLVMVPILGVLLYRQVPHIIVWPAALCALFGIFLLSGGRLDALSRGDALIIVAAFFFAMQILLINRYANESGLPVTLAFIQFAVTAVLGLAVAVPLETLDWTAILLATPEFLFSGVFAAGIAFTLQAIGQRHTTSANAAILLSSEALFAALFGALLLGDRLTAMALAGCALIFIAILSTELVPAWLQARESKAKS